MYWILCGIYSVPQELKDTIFEELDFEHEGHNQERCAQELRHLSYVCVPKIYWRHTSKVRGGRERGEEREREREKVKDKRQICHNYHFHVACVDFTMD